MDRTTFDRILKNVKPSSVVKVTTWTPVSLKGGKKNPHQGRIFKQVTNMEVAFFGMKRFASYEEWVKTQMIAEGKDPDTFTAGKLPWGTIVKDTPLLEHKDQFYLRMIALDSGVKTKYFIQVTDYGDERLDPIDKDEIQGMEPSVPVKPEEERKVQQGGIKDNIQVRSIKLENILKIDVDGVEYV